MANNRYPIFSIPTDLVFPSLETRSIINLAKTCRAGREKLANVLEERQASVLLGHVIHSDWKKVETILSKCPQLIFVKVNATISPLRWAIKEYNVHMQKLFLRYLDSQLIDKFLQQAQEQKEFFDLAPMLDVYESYLEKYKQWQQGSISTTDLQNCWVTVVAPAQLRLLPMHIYRLMHTDGGSQSRLAWSADAKFDEQTPPTGTALIYQMALGPNVSYTKNNLKTPPELGPHVYGIYYWNTGGANQYHVADDDCILDKRIDIENPPIRFVYDMIVLRRLFERRKQQQAELLSLLQLTHDPSFIELEKTIQHYSALDLKPAHGLFAGKSTRQMREIQHWFEKIKLKTCSIKEAIQHIKDLAKEMGPQHPILKAANKCHGKCVDQESLLRRACR